MEGSSTPCLVFLLEELSAKAFLEEFIYRAFPELKEWQVRFLVFEGKRDLEKKLVRRLRGWQAPNSYFVILRDRDSEDCVLLKQRLCDLVRQAGRDHCTLVRIACAELESWYLGELASVGAVYGIANLERRQVVRKFRDPDLLGSPAVELIGLTGARYQKVGGSRQLGKALSCSVNKNVSASFGAFVTGLGRFVRRISDPQGNA